MTIDDLKNSPGKLDSSPFIKNLAYKDKKNLLYFFIAHGDTRVGKNVFKEIGTNYNKCRAANEKYLNPLEAKKGSISVFNILNDNEEEKLIKTVVIEK